MNCAEIQELLSVYIDEACTHSEALDVEDHLNTCPECMKEYVWLKKIVEELNDLDEIDVPEGFHEELMQKIQGEASTKKRFPRFSYRYSIIAASLCLTVIFGLLGVKMFKEIMLETQKSTMTATMETYDMTSTESSQMTESVDSASQPFMVEAPAETYSDGSAATEIPAEEAAITESDADTAAITAESLEESASMDARMVEEAPPEPEIAQSKIAVNESATAETAEGIVDEEAKTGVKPETIALVTLIAAMLYLSGKFFNVGKYRRNQKKKDDYKR